MICSVNEPIIFKWWNLIWQRNHLHIILVEEEVEHLKLGRLYVQCGTHSLWPATQRHTCKGWWKPIPLWCLRQRVVCTDVVFGNVRLQQPGWRIHQCTRLSISRWRVQACGYICRISKQFLPRQHWNYFFAVSNSCRHTGFQRTGKHRKHTHTHEPIMCHVHKLWFLQTAWFWAPRRYWNSTCFLQNLSDVFASSKWRLLEVGSV